MPQNSSAPYQCQNKFLSDCDFTIVFKNNRGKTACILISQKKNSLPTKDVVSTSAYDWHLSGVTTALQELCQAPSSLTSFSTTTSFFSAHISHQLPLFCPQMLIHSIFLWSTLWEGTKTISLTVIFPCDDVWYNEI